MGVSSSSFDAVPASAERPSKEAIGKPSRSAADSQVTLIKDVDLAVCDSNDTLSLGYLLEWMDAASCLAAEKHCGRYAVTLVMDDLDFADDCCELLHRGERCILEGKVTRAFGSSMEVVVHVSVADVRSARLRSVCSAYFMYVVLKTDSEKASAAKIEVPGLVPHTVNEHLEFGLADLRRAFRKKRDQSVEQLCTGSTAALKREVSLPQAQCRQVSFTELVLPYHANHMGNTFGGQIMAWMVKGAKSAVWLHLRASCVSSNADVDAQEAVGVGGEPKIQVHQLKHAWLRPVSIDTIHFKAPSHVGDRVKVIAAVTRVFSSSIEVHVRVTSTAVDAQDTPKEVNAGYLSFALHGSDGPITESVCDVVPGTIEQDEEHRRAVARQQFRELRKQQTLKPKQSSHGMDFSVNFDPDGNQATELAVQCISCILSLNESVELRWERLLKSTSDIPAWVELGLKRPGAITRLKMQAQVDCPPRDCYNLLKDVSRRHEFDISCLECSVEKSCGDDADLVRMVFASPRVDVDSPTASQQEVLLLRAYKEDEASNSFVLCSRSVRCDSRPVAPGLARGELLPSGYLISECQESGGKRSIITFLGQFSNELFELLVPHVFETVKKFSHIAEKEALGLSKKSGGYP